MKLLMESWKQYLNEEALKSEMIEMLTNNGITLTEEQLNEINWKALLSKYGTKAAVLAALAGTGAPAQAGVGDWIQSARDSIVNVINPTDATPETEDGVSADGNSFTASFEIGSDIGMAKTQAEASARAGASTHNIDDAQISSSAPNPSGTHWMTTITGAP